MQHDLIALFVVIEIEHGVDAGFVDAAFHGLGVLVCEHLARAVFVVSCHLHGLFGVGNAHEGGLQGVRQRILAVEGAQEEVACSDGLFEGSAPRARRAGGQFDAIALDTILVGHGGIVRSGCVRTGNHVAFVARCPDALDGSVVAHIIPKVIMTVGTQFEVLEVVFVAGQRGLAEVHNIGTVPLAVL